MISFWIFAIRFGPESFCIINTSPKKLISGRTFYRFRKDDIRWALAREMIILTVYGFSDVVAPKGPNQIRKWERLTTKWLKLPLLLENVYILQAEYNLSICI